MAIIHYTEATGGLPNSGRMSGTDGDFVGVADLAFVAAGWAIEFTSGNARVYRPATGNRFRYCFNDAAAASGDARACVFRCAESASSATSWTDPFPTVARIADGSSNLLKSSTANTTARNFDLFVGPTWFMFFVNYNGTANNWDGVIAGDVVPALSGDSYNTISIVRNSATFTSNGLLWSSGATGANGVVQVSWARTYDGTVKSPSGGIPYPGTTIGQINSAPNAQSGPSTGIDMQKVAILDVGATSTSVSSSLGIPVRGWFPNLWLGMHGGRGSVNARDTFTNTSYNGSASFTVFCASANAWVIVETTDTWSAPSG